MPRSRAKSAGDPDSPKVVIIGTRAVSLAVHSPRSGIHPSECSVVDRPEMSSGRSTSEAGFQQPSPTSAEHTPSGASMPLGAVESLISELSSAESLNMTMFHSVNSLGRLQRVPTAEVATQSSGRGVPLQVACSRPDLQCTPFPKSANQSSCSDSAEELDRRQTHDHEGCPGPGIGEVPQKLRPLRVPSRLGDSNATPSSLVDGELPSDFSVFNNILSDDAHDTPEARCTFERGYRPSGTGASLSLVHAPCLAPVASQSAFVCPPPGAGPQSRRTLLLRQQGAGTGMMGRPGRGEQLQSMAELPLQLRQTTSLMAFPTVPVPASGLGAAAAADSLAAIESLQLQRSMMLQRLKIMEEYIRRASAMQATMLKQVSGPHGIRSHDGQRAREAKSGSIAISNEAAASLSRPRVHWPKAEGSRALSPPRRPHRKHRGKKRVSVAVKASSDHVKSSSASDGTRQSAAASSHTLAALEVTTDATDGDLVTSMKEVQSMSGKDARGLPLGGTEVPKSGLDDGPVVDVVDTDPSKALSGAKAGTWVQSSPGKSARRRAGFWRRFVRAPQAGRAMRTAAAPEDDDWPVQCGCL